MPLPGQISVAIYNRPIDIVSVEDQWHVTFRCVRGPRAAHRHSSTAAIERGTYPEGL